MGRKGYLKVRTLAEAHEKLKRTRTRKHVILTDDSPDLVHPCACCGKALGDHGDTPNGYRSNRVEYLKGEFTLMHYTCSWQTLLETVAKIRL